MHLFAWMRILLSGCLDYLYRPCGIAEPVLLFYRYGTETMKPLIEPNLLQVPEVPMEGHDATTDFSIRCLPEDVTVAVQKVALVEASDVFANMFACCHEGDDRKGIQCVDIYETVNDMAILVRLLHDRPPPLPEPKPQGQSSERSKKPSPAIPYLLLPRLFALADKYALKSPIMQVLEAHLLGQAPIAPLLVYGVAIQHSLPETADKASEFLALTPLETYSIEDIKVIPTVEAYHGLLQLQSHRKRKLRGLLMNEELFPHGYGACSVHRSHAEAAWDRRRRSILPNLHSGTKVAAIMSRRLDTTVRTCKVCKKAWVAATDMLAYRCGKIARRISQMNKEGY